MNQEEVKLIVVSVIEEEMRRKRAALDKAQKYAIIGFIITSITMIIGLYCVNS